MIINRQAVATALATILILLSAAAPPSPAAQRDYKLQETQLSPMGDITVEYRNNNNTDAREIWLIDKAAKSARRLYVHHRNPRVLFSPEQSRLVISDDYGSSAARLIAYKRIKGIDYQREKLSLNRDLWTFFRKVNGFEKSDFVPDAAHFDEDDHRDDEEHGFYHYAPYDHHYLRGLQWINENLLVVGLEGHEGGGEYAEEWLCIYDFRTNKPLLNLGELNQGSVHHRKE